MRKIVVTEFVTLDGVMQSPHEWSLAYWNDEIAEIKNDEMFASDAQLLGRVTYQGFAEAWPSRDGDYADRLNGLPKYVVSTTLKNAKWQNSHLIQNNVVQEIRNLKQEPGKDILVHGSQTLVQTLVQHDLVDQFTLLLYPVVLGQGMRLFGDGVNTNLKLDQTKTFDTGVILLRYSKDQE